DLRIFYLTRRLAALEINRSAYRSLFGADPLTGFRREFRALAGAGLVEVTPRSVTPTPRGMFYADSIAALLAWRRMRALRQEGHSTGNPRGRTSARTEVPQTGRATRNDNDFGHM